MYSVWTGWVLLSAEGLAVLHLSGFMNNLNRNEKWWEASVNKDNRCEDLLKMRSDRGEIYTKKTEVRHQKTRVKGGKKDTARERNVNRSEVWKKSARERKDTGREKVRWREEKCSARGGIYVRVSSAQRGCLLKGSLIQTGREKGLWLQRRLIEQRASNCSIRLSRKSGSKNEFSNSTKLFMTHLSKYTKEKKKKTKTQFVPR